MHLKRLIPILIFILAIPVLGYSQEKIEQSKVKTEQTRELQESQQKKRAQVIKSVPITNKTNEAIRLQNKKATMEQMHTINKAMRKSMTVHKRR